MIDKQVIPVVLREGIDTKSSTRAQVAGRLVELENGVFTKSGEIRKRYGYDRVVAHVENGAAISQADGVATFRNELLLFGENGRVHSLSGAIDRWLDRGGIVSVGVNERSVVRNSAAQSVPDVARGGDMTCIAWEDSRGGVRYSLFDDETGAPLVADVEVSSTGTRPRIVATGTQFIIFYSAGACIFYKAVSFADPTTLGVEQNPIATISSSIASWDVCTASNIVHIVWCEAAAVKYGYLNASLAFTTVGTVAAITPVLAACWVDTSSRLWALASSSTAQSVTVYNSSFAVTLATTTVGALSSPTRMAGVTVGDTATMLFENSGSVVSKATCTIAGTVSSAATLVRSVGLIGRPFNHGGANVYAPVAYTSSAALQDTAFVIDASSGRVIAKTTPGLSGAARSRGTVSNVASVSSGAFTFAANVKTALESSTGGLFSRDGVGLVDLDFNAEARYLSAELGNNLHIAGGVLHAYDGVNLVEHGFHLFPEKPTHTVTAAVGSIDAGAHQWRAVYEWTDAQGQVHRSAPSQALSVTTAANDRVNLSVSTLRLTSKSQVRVVFYRTLAAGDIFYRLNAIASPLLNDTTTDTVSYPDTASDASITGNEVLYTDGSPGEELENLAPPASSAICSHRSRLFLVTGRNRVSYSKQVLDGSPVEFSDALYVATDARGGAVTAVASMDDKLVIFKEHAIFVLFGDGPNAAGSGDFREPELVTSDVGCTEVRSVIGTNAGLMFKSSKGIYLLDRALSVSYIGANVEAYNDLTITSANVVPNTNEVRFTTSGSVTIDNEVRTGIALVYDYVFGQWATFTNHYAVDACVWGDDYVWVRSNGKIYRENRTLYTDDSAFVKLKITTSWLTFAGISAYQRVSRVLCLGEFKSGHSFRVRLGYDYAPEYTYDGTVDVSDVLDVTTWGGDVAWGTGPVWGGYYPSWWWRVQPNVQKCSAIRVSVEDSQTSNYGEGYAISSFAFLVGMKRGTHKLAADPGRSK